MKLILRYIAYISTLIILMVCVTNSHAQWSTNPREAVGFNGIYDVDLVSDSVGGVFLAASAQDLITYCYYLDSGGNARWDEWVETAP